jgi:hypothetical protein
MSRKFRAVPRLKDGRLLFRSKWYVALRVAAQMLGDDEDSVLRWTEFKCPWIARKLRSRKMVVQDGQRCLSMRLYLEADIQQILRSMNQSSVNDPPHPTKDPWPSTAEVLAQGFSSDLLKRCRRKRKIRTRPGTRVREDGQPQTVTEWDPKALKEIQTHREMVAAGRRPGYVTDAEAGKAPYGFAASTLARWRDPNGKGCRYLGRLLDAFQAQGTCTWYNSIADLKEILEKRRLGPLDPHVDAEGVWLPTGLVERRHGVIEQTLNHIRRRDEVGRKRRGPGGRPRSAPSVRSKVIDRPHPKIPNGKLRVWHQQDLLRYIAWRAGEPFPVSAESAPPKVSTDAADLPNKKGRGRPRGKTKAWLEREQKMLGAWDRGEYKSMAEAGRAHNFYPADASRIIKAHEAGKR